ncbi:MAG: F0F1 ATP synthase subunit delta [Candidatus Sungbacteria bacterium]|nr:F0F1 ATP synthase subunit delta [Candidatus Sungbacteria bacterium]
MKYTIKQYAEALYNALEKKKAKEAAEIGRRFFAVVRKNGDSPRMELILREFHKEYLKQKNLRAVKIEMASAVPARVKREIKNILGGEIMFTEQENSSLGAGIRITIDGEILIDASAKKQLEKIYA